MIKEIPYREPVGVFESFREQPYSFFLDSGMDAKRLGRYSLIGCDPFLVFKCKGKEIEIVNKKPFTGDPFQVLQNLMSTYYAGNDSRFPLAAGAFGYFGYDLGLLGMENIRGKARDDLGLPDCYLGFYDRLVIFDHCLKQMFLTSTGLPEQGRAADIRSGERLQELERYVTADPENNSSAGLIDGDYEGAEYTGEMPAISGHFNYDTYCAAIRKVKGYIERGEIKEAILSQRFSGRIGIEPWLLYRRLRKINPAPFAAYLHYPELDIVSASPERFIKVSGGFVETRPIKGTRPRGKDLREDRQLRTELLHSEKDHAELGAITELVAGELQAVCREGSVRVEEEFRLEEYPTVFHLVSTVGGRLAADKDLIDLLRAAFPAGSISGAPKPRAMEIIDELEPVKRGIYTGSIGYLGFNGNADLNVVIRTIIITGGTAYLQVGGGIINSSQPGEEYRETLTKARALFKALGDKGEAK